jgi:hypothetical protein
MLSFALTVAAVLQTIPVAAQPITTPPAPADWRTRPMTAGSWTWRTSADVSEAAFSDSRGIQFVLRCTRATRRVSFSRPGAPVSTPIRIATTSSERQLGIGNAVAANDPLLDAIAFTRGRLWVAAGATMPLVLRSAAEPARAVEDCRS